MTGETSPTTHDAPQSTTQATPPRNNTRIILVFVGVGVLLIAVVVAVAGISVGLYFYNQSSSNTTASNPSTPFSAPRENRRPINEFKALRRATGNSLAGYQADGDNAQVIVNKFGNPTKTEDLGDFFRTKVLVYPVTDEFGNKASAVGDYRLLW